MSAGINAKASIDGAKKFQDDLKAMTAKGKALDAEMKALTSSFDKEGKSQKDNAKQREALNKAIEAQKEKAKLLSDQIKKLEDAGEGETTQCYKLREQLAQTNQKINEYSNGQSKAAKETGTSVASMVKAGAALAAMKVAATAVVGALRGIASAAVKAAKGVWSLGTDAGEWADSLITQGNQFGIDTDTLQEWGYASRFIDTEVSTMTNGMKKLTQQYAKGTSARKKSVKIAKGVTVSLKKENGEIKTQAEFYLDVIDSLHGMSNIAQRNAAAQKLFGKSYTDMIPLIESGTSAIRQYSAEARDMGIIISADNVGALGAFDDSMQRFDATIGAIKTNLAVALLPVLELVSGRLVTFMGTVSKAISDGLQPEDVGTIVDAFFDMFKFENGDENKQATSIFSFVGELISRLKEKVLEHKEDIKTVAVTVAQVIVDAFKEVLGLTGLGEKIFGEEGTFLGFKVEEGSLFDKFSKWAKSAYNGFMEGFQLGESEQEQYSAGDTVFESLQDRLDSAQAKTDYQSWGSDMTSEFVDGMTSAQPEVESAAEAEIGAVEKHTGPSAHSKTTHWGHELASGYADGIRSGIPEVSAASEALARAAAAPIHYSLPDYGPLREVGKWGGEMIDKYVMGIRRNAWKVSSAIGGAIPNVNPMGATTNYGGVSINVYGAAGQDVNQLADIVMAKMQNAVNRREAVFA